MNSQELLLQEYSVEVKRIDDKLAQANRDEHRLLLSIKRGERMYGFNAVEALLSSLGTCILTNVNDFSSKLRLDIRAASVRLTAFRHDRPPKVISIDYELMLDSPDPVEKLEELHSYCKKWGTVYNTLADAIPINGKLIVSNNRPENR